MIIGLSGLLKSGKDTVGQMIMDLDTTMEAREDMGAGYVTRCDKCWQIRKFAYRLKQVASIMTGIPIEKFEDQDFKESYMPREWNETIMEYSADGVDIVETSEPITVRRFLQKLGTDAIRDQVHKDAWVIAAMSDYGCKCGGKCKGNCKCEKKNWIFTDVRFPNEAQAIKDKGGYVIRINRHIPGVSTKLMKLHESETALDDWEFDHVIWNNGTLDDLRNMVKEIMSRINSKSLEKA